MSPLFTGLGLWVLMAFPVASLGASGCADTAACQHHCAMSQGCSCNPFPATARLRRITPVAAIMSSRWYSDIGAHCMNLRVGDACHTENTENFPWIAFQLSQAHPVFVSHVTVISTSTNSNRLRNLEVRVSNTQPLIGDKKFTEGTKIGATFRGPASDNQILDFFANNDVSGKWVVLQMQNRNYLHVAEVIVYGY